MKWSKYSEALFDLFVTSGENIIVQACPGAGKTTNIKHLWELNDKPQVYLVFNKANQLEAEAKLPMKQGSAVLTLNGLGHRALLSTYGTVQLVKNKTFRLIDSGLSQLWGLHGLSHAEVQERRLMLVKAVSKAKMIASRLDEEQYSSMVTVYDLETYDAMLEDVNSVLAASDTHAHEQGVIDFDDQIRIPALYQCALPEYHTVLGDEVQDFNPMQAQLVSKLGAERYVFVGDKRQSIYGFRGAMNDSMQYLKDTFSCTELPLSITYRCAKHIVAHAYAIWPDIEAWEESPDGVIAHCARDDDHHVLSRFQASSDPAENIVLCRNNRQLVSYAYELLASGIACHVRGRDIGEGLVRLITRLDVVNVLGLIEALHEWHATETAKAVGDEAKLQSIADKYGSLMLFIERCRLGDPVEVVIELVNAMFEQGKGVCLSTVHKAKGLEAVRAYLLDHGLFDYAHSRCSQAWQAEQELNVKYVAVTRAKQGLVYM